MKNEAILNEELDPKLVRWCDSLSLSLSLHLLSLSASPSLSLYYLIIIPSPPPPPPTHTDGGSFEAAGPGSEGGAKHGYWRGEDR